MKRSNMSSWAPAAAVVAWLGLFAVAPATAAVSFQTGHQQVGHAINMDGLSDAYVVTGHVQTAGGPSVEFKNAVNASNSAVLLHSGNGVSKIEACGPCSPAGSYTDAPFTFIDMVVQPGYGFTDMDWAISIWDHNATGTISFTAYDQFNNPTSSGAFVIDGDNSANGHTKWHFHADGGTLVTRLSFSSSIDLHHLEQMSAFYAPVPESGTLLLMALGIGAIVPVVRRRASAQG